MFWHLLVWIFTVIEGTVYLGFCWSTKNLLKQILTLWDILKNGMDVSVLIHTSRVNLEKGVINRANNSVQQTSSAMSLRLFMFDVFCCGRQHRGTCEWLWRGKETICAKRNIGGHVYGPEYVRHWPGNWEIAWWRQALAWNTSGQSRLDHNELTALTSRNKSLYAEVSFTVDGLFLFKSVVDYQVFIRVVIVCLSLYLNGC